MVNARVSVVVDDQAVVVKNTFIERVEESDSPVASAPPTKTAPGSLVQEAPAEAATVPPRASILRRLFGPRRREGAPEEEDEPAAAAAEARGPQKKKSVRIAVVATTSTSSTGSSSASSSSSSSPTPPRIPVALGTPVALQEKNTFVHFEEAPVTPAAPPTKTAPGHAVFLEAPSADEDATPPPPPPVLTGGSPSGLGLRRDFEFEAAPPIIVEVAAPPPPPAPAAPARTRCCASLGSCGHHDGQCIPCLMQVRWRAGKCAEPCRFGEMCGRCHEPHTEEELHRIQAQMRKLKRQRGAAGAAELSAAYVRGTAAPVGAGAGKAASMTKRGAGVMKVSL